MSLFVEFLPHCKIILFMFWKLLIVAAFLGMLKALIAPWFDNLCDGIAWLLSFVIMGLFLGIVLAGVMIIGEFMCIFDSMYIFGIHPFWVGFAIGTVWSVVSRLIFWIKTR